MRHGARKWSEDEVAALVRMRNVNGLTFVQIAAKLGRPANSCQQRYTVETAGKRRVSKFGPKNTNAAGDVVARVPEETMAEREHRLGLRDLRNEQHFARGDVTPSFFGDPPPGYSALDRKQQAEGRA